ncbi:MAG TPA: mechanosensitive ion channel domain-containing protein [Opitutus sp.]|nr:mechanosensitive ion channel domain-containing protein [Opitutus sp.]
MIPRLQLLFAESYPEHWLDYPIVRLGSATLTLLVVLKVLLWIVGVLAADVFIRRLLLRRLLEHTHFDPGLRFAVSRMFSYAFVTLGFYVALVVNGVDLSSLAVVAGALGIGIGFGLQNIVANFVSGLVLLAERPVAVGDRIEVAGVAGNVTKISLRATTVVTNDNISIIVPNSDLTSHPITNWSHGDPRVRVRLPIGVAYGTDPERLTAALLAVAAANPHVLREPEPRVYFIAFGDSSLDFELAVWTQEHTHAPRRFRSDLNFAVERKLRETGIEIPFPQRVVHLRPAPGGDAAPAPPA